MSLRKGGGINDSIDLNPSAQPGPGAVLRVQTSPQQEICMRRPMAVVALGAVFSLSACSSAEEKLCRANVTEGLLNPETASFSDFKAISAQEIASDEFLSHMPDMMDSLISKKGATYYRMRVRAEGQLGNKITKTQVCAVDAKKANCACIATN
jgi:hypothetical protein